MAFMGLTYCGPQNLYKHYDKQPNDYNLSLRARLGEDMLTEHMKTVQFDRPEMTDAEVFEDDSAHHQLKKTLMQQRPDKSQHTSHTSLREDIEVRHGRLGGPVPTTIWNKPLTTSQEVGWRHAQLKPEPPAEPTGEDPTMRSFLGQIGKTNFPIKSSEETRYAQVMLALGHGTR